VDLADWRPGEWSQVRVRARTSGSIRSMLLGLNPREQPAPINATQATFQLNGGITPIVSDGSVQTYLIRPNWGRGSAQAGPWRRVGLGFFAPEPGSIDILSVSVIPTAARYNAARVGMQSTSIDRVYRRSLFTHAPGRIAYRVQVPEAARLETALGVIRADTPVEFRVVAEPADGDTVTLLSETYEDEDLWAERSVDLSEFAGQTLTLSLETDSDAPGTVALWGTPTLSGARVTDRPNVILYIFDGGGADYMSAYGYHRRTTPTLERLAAEGALFEHAYSNSRWTLPSTASFMTSLQSSVTGGLPGGRTNQIPDSALTMAERMHRAGYQTAVFTGNPYAGTLSGLQRGVDVFREDWADFSYFGGNNHKESSRYLHEGFWDWREASPHEPFWVHFQTTDTHRDFPAPTPFAGLFVDQAQRERYLQDLDRIEAAWEAELDGGDPFAAYDSLGISRTDLEAVAIGLYGEAMAHNDYRLGQLVDRLKARGEWENTLLIIGGDHSIAAAIGNVAPRLMDPMPPLWSQSLLQPHESRVPLILVWPGHIQGGQRLDQPVSMIDVLPTLLDLVGLRQLNGGLHWTKVEKLLKGYGAEVHEGRG